MKIITESIKVKSAGNRPAFHTVTEKVKEIIAGSGIVNGVCIVYSKHTTCAVMIDEDSIDRAYTGLTYLQQDLADVFEKIIPACRKEGQYMHPGPKLTIFSAEHGEDKPGTLNTDAHLRSSILGRSESIPIIGGRLELGEFGHIYFVDFDHTRARERSITVQVMGEQAVKDTHRLRDGRVIINAKPMGRCKYRREAVATEIARSDKDSNVRKAAVCAIYNTAALMEIVRTDEDQCVRETAAGRIQDDTVLIDLARNHLESAVRRVAYGEIKNKVVLKELAADPQHFFRSDVIETITDELILIQFAKKNDNSNHRIIARISDGKALNRLIGNLIEYTNTLDCYVSAADGENALIQITKTIRDFDRDGSGYYAQFENGTDSFTTFTITLMVRNEDALREINKNNKYKLVRDAAKLIKYKQKLVGAKGDRQS